MAYVNVADWKPEQVAEWLKGLDNVVLQYIRLFVEKSINGQQLLDLQPNDLEEIGVFKIGHQEIILGAIDLLKNFYYDLDRENLQLLALRLSCLAHSLHNELWRNHINSNIVSTQILADVANVVSAVKPLVCWLDRSPFCDQSSYVDQKNELLNLSLEMAMSGMRDRFVDKPIEYILQSCKQLAELVDKMIQSIDDSLLLQPASLDLATLKKRPGDHLGFYIVPSFHGILQVGELKCNSAAHQSGKIETGDEIVQINYQTVVGWEVKEVMGLLFEETSTEILMTLKKRPRHSKVFGQIYIKPYRLPCRKQINYPSKWNDLLSPSRPELLTVPPHFGLHFKFVPFHKNLNSKPITTTVQTQVEDRVSPPSPTPSTVSSSSSQSSECELMVGPSSPNSMRMYLPKPRIPVQRRATISGASPVSKQAPLSLEQFWHELKLEKEWRSNSDEKACEKANSETHLRRSPPAAHCSLTWSARLCEQMDPSVSDSSSSEKNTKSDKENIETNSFIPLKQRIDSLNKAIEQTSQNAKKPKPILSNVQNTISKMESSSKPSSPLRTNIAKKGDRSPRRERGKLDKSYSTPSYDYSADSKEPLTFNMKLPEEKVKSAPDNITSESDSLTEFKKSLEMKPFPKSIKHDFHEMKPEQNEYLEIKSDGVIEPESTDSSTSLPSEQDSSSNKNKILDTINSSLLNMDSESEANSLSEESPKPRPPLERSNPVQEIRPDMSMFERELKNELNEISHEIVPKQIINSPISPTEKLVIHTTIDVPATFPRHKIDKKPISPPEPPPRPLKNSASHSKANQKATNVTKSASRSISHKSPKAPRKKNPLLAKRRNVSVKELGICDHEGTLYHRARKNSRESPHWIRGWFIIKGTIFYGFNSRDASHARLMISLPGFTVSPAEEVKSKNFAFKVYHTGTTFYFAAESGEDLAGWVDSFSKVTVSEEEQTIVMSETDGEEDENPTTTAKKDKGSHEHGPHVAAKKILSVLSGHLSHTQENKGDKKFNSLKKPSRKLAKEESQDGNHVASLDRKYRKLFPVGGKQSIVAVPTAQFRSYRRVPPMEKPPAQLPEPNLPLDHNRPESLACTATVPSASPTRPPDMADYRLASLAKCNANNQRTPEASQPGGSMTLESFMLSRQEEERRQQQQQHQQQQQQHPPHATNILRVPQCHAPPPPTPIANHSAAVATGHDLPFLLPCSTSRLRTDFSSHYAKSSENPSSADFRPKILKKPAQYQPPPWETSNNNHNEESSRLQPAFEMTLDRNCPATSTVNMKPKKTEETSSSTLRFKSLFGSSKSDGQKTNLLSSPRLRRLFRDKKPQTTFNSNTVVPSDTSSFMERNATDVPIPTTSHSLEMSIPNTPEYPGLEYPPVFEPGTYSLSDVLRNRRMRTLERSELEAMHQGEPFPDDASSSQAQFTNLLYTDNENNNFTNRREDRNNDELFRSNNFKRF